MEEPTLQQKRNNPDLLPLCACGCGEKVKGYRSKYLKYHFQRDPNYVPPIKKECQPCACGCGELTKHPDAKFINGHYLKLLKKEGRSEECTCRDAHDRMSNETYMEVCRKRSENMQGNKNWKNSSGFTGHHHSEEYKIECAIRAKELQEDPNSKFGKLHPTSGNGKTGLRKIGDKEIWFRSSWEANFARILNYRGLNFIFEPKWYKIPTSEGYEDTHYVPDFFVESENKFYEIKGYTQEDDLYKMRKFVEIYKAELILIDPEEYKKLEKEFKDKIVDWE